MAAFSRVGVNGWTQGDDASASSRVGVRGWAQVNAIDGGVDGSVTLSGATTTASAGTLSSTGAAGIALSGASASASAGTVSASAGSDATAAIGGASTTASAGALTATGAASITLTGASVEALATAPIATGDAAITISGASTTASAGTVGASVSTGGGTGATAAEIWSYTLSNGLTAEATLVAIHTMLSELHLIHGLTAGSPLSVTAASRTAGAVSQAVAEAAGTVTVTRQ